MEIGYMYRALKIAIPLFLGLFLFTAGYAGKAVKDPTKPPAYGREFNTYTSVKRKGIEISAIYFGENKDDRSVFVEGRIFRIGDKVLNSVITEINKDSIKLKNEEGESEVFMPYLAVKSLVKKSKNEGSKKND